MSHVNILFHAPESMHDAIKAHCLEQRITIKSFMQRAVANELRATRHAIPIPDLKIKAVSEYTSDDQYAEPVRTPRKRRIKL